MRAVRESEYGVGHEVRHEPAHGHDAGHGHDRESFWSAWWPLFVILFGFTFFLIVALWKPSY